MSDLRRRLYPETEAGGYSRSDTTVEFYTRVRSLLAPDAVVVDLGCGRGGFMDAAPGYKRDVQLLKGVASRVVGLDVDPAGEHNPSLDEFHLLGEDGRWPLPDASVDLVLSDWTFEHVENPVVVAAEAARVVKPGGWVCARTPNRRGYISVAARAIPRGLHGRVLSAVQPHRQTRDVFPACYLLNTPTDVRRAFADFRVVHYPVFGEPAYFATSPVAWRAVQAAHRVLPNALAPVQLFFLQRRQMSDEPSGPILSAGQRRRRT